MWYMSVKLFRFLCFNKQIFCLLSWIYIVHLDTKNKWNFLILYKLFFRWSQAGTSQIDPIIIESIDLFQETGPVRINADFHNLVLSGLSKSTIYHVSGFATDNLEIHFKAPLISIVGPYKVKGQVLVLPINGGGNARLKFGTYLSIFIKNSKWWTFSENFDAKMTFSIKRILKNGKLFVQLDQPKMTFDVTG